jgi:hypothetical protein
MVNFDAAIGDYDEAGRSCTCFGIGMGNFEL